MRKEFAKFLAGVLTTTLIFSSGSHIMYAAQEKSVSPVAVSSETETSAETGINVQTVSPAAVEAQFWNKEGTTLIRGSVEVMITAGIEVKKDQAFQVTLKKNEGKEYSEKIILSKSNGTDVSRVSVRFSELEAGTYTLSVSGKGYITYEQSNIKVENLGYRIQIYTGKEMENSGKNQPGLLRPGDIVEDGLLNEKDAKALVDAIDTESKEEKYDLNGDGKVDLLDLSYFTEFLSKKPKTATIEKLLPAEAIDFVLSEGTKVESGSIDKMLIGKSEISLIYGAKEIITETTPIELSFDFTKSKEQMKMDGMVIKPSKDGKGAMEEGKVTIYYEENGKIQSVETSIPASNSVSNSGQAPRGIMESGIGVVTVVPIWQKNGELFINLSSQIAVKKVVLRITKTSETRNLARISSVEFVNDMESRIPDLVMNISINLNTEAGQ